MKRDAPWAVSNGSIDDILRAIHDWATPLGNAVQVSQRPNGFINLAAIGATPAKRDGWAINTRSRDNQCLVNIYILQYAVIDVLDLDPNINLRVAGTCSA